MEWLSFLEFEVSDPKIADERLSGESYASD